jgi:Flp pilus assembly protein CpaB
MNWTILFSVIAACVTVGGVLLAAGMLKGKIAQNTEVNAAQNEQIKQLVSKKELDTATERGNDKLAAAILHSDEMLKLMKERAEEDRIKGEGKYREFYGLITSHAERISALETQQNALTKSLDEIKSDIKTGFRELQAELKEFRKHV